MAKSKSTNSTRKTTRKTCAAKIAIAEISAIFKNHNIDRARFYPMIDTKGKTILPVDWSDTREVDGKATAGDSGVIIYQFDSPEVAATVQDKVLNLEPAVGDKVKFKLNSDQLTFGPRPGISLKDVEAVVYSRDEAIPTTAGLKLLIKRAEASNTFNSDWTKQLKYDLERPENSRLTRLLARGYTCTILSKEKPSVEHLTTQILGEKATPNNIAKYNRIKTIIQEELKQLKKEWFSKLIQPAAPVKNTKKK